MGRHVFKKRPCATRWHWESVGTRPIFCQFQGRPETHNNISIGSNIANALLFLSHRTNHFDPEVAENFLNQDFRINDRYLETEVNKTNLLRVFSSDIARYTFSRNFMMTGRRVIP